MRRAGKMWRYHYFYILLCCGIFCCYAGVGIIAEKIMKTVDDRLVLLIHKLKYGELFILVAF